ncbi:MAG TPA: alpha/beta hydrolase [Verrucomicrobiae bacterium]|nr:alpha/beta hydrolase [Verrucomicrobiae bacterium]
MPTTDDKSSAIRVTRESRGRVPGDAIELAFGFWPGKGAPVVALHGLTASYLNFIGVAERLAGRLPLLALDLRGRGDSDKPEAPYGFSQHAKDVAAAMRAFGLGPSVILGHSMGAFIAAALAAQFPELVSGLVLVDGGYIPDRSAGVAADAAVNAALLERVTQLRESHPSREAYVELWRRKPHFPPDAHAPWVRAFLEYEVGGEGPVKPKAYEIGVVADLSEGRGRDEIVSRLRAVRVPVLLLRAEHGFLPTQPPLFPDARVDEIRSLVPQIQDRKIPGTTHYTIMLGNPGATAIADLLVEFAPR